MKSSKKEEKIKNEILTGIYIEFFTLTIYFYYYISFSFLDILYLLLYIL